MARADTAVRRLILPALVLPLALGACGDDPVGPAFPEDVEFAASLGIDLDEMTRLPDGVYIETLVEGPEDEVPVTSGEVLVDYALWLPDGRLLQSTFEDASVALDFELGMNEVIPGFESGMIGGGSNAMKVGELRRIIVPSEMGYGATGQGEIPPQTVLVFEVELLATPGSEPT